ncbi:hypothetical protein CPB84DRAFT_257610 [Gymnopilus junonius]|uniref:Uncharacterized protein n=1 Tax=Gymnopilus junonius TaxID=109634 RepID=A0A9P5TJ06_GYMJU|nr:hypothetical protein CPB84DRAFT_257610 [Gymnopilus junonius]
MGSLLPVSNDRDSIMSEPHPRHSKRHRRTTLDSMNPGDRSPALQPGGRNSSMIGDRPPVTEQYRDPERFYLKCEHLLFTIQRLTRIMASTACITQDSNPNPSYTPMYSGYAQNSPPPSFVPVNAAYGAHRGGHSSFSHDMGPAHPQGGNAGAGTSRDAGERFPAAPLPQYDPSLFHPPTGMEPPRHLPADDQGNKRAVDERDGTGAERAMVDPVVEDLLALTGPVIDMDTFADGVSSSQR